MKEIFVVFGAEQKTSKLWELFGWGTYKAFALNCGTGPKSKMDFPINTTTEHHATHCSRDTT